MKFLKLTGPNGTPIAINAEIIIDVTPSMCFDQLWDKSLERQYSACVNVVGRGSIEVREKFVTVVEMLEALP